MMVVVVVKQEGASIWMVLVRREAVVYGEY